MYLHGYYVPLFLDFLYISTNLFTYAITFDQVKRILVRLIPWHNSSQPPSDTDGSSSPTYLLSVRNTGGT